MSHKKFGRDRAYLCFLVFVSFCLGLPATALAGVFGPPDHYLVRGVKPDTDAQRFRLGLSFEIAPIQAVAKQVVEDAVGSNEDLAKISGVLAEVDLDRAEGMSASQLKEELKKRPELSQEDRDAIDSAITDDQVEQALAVAKILQQPEESLAFSIRPKAALNFEPVLFVAELPLAGFELGGESEFVVGNVNLDMRFGHTFGDAGIGLGISYGLHTYFPTGSDQASTLAHTNLLNAPLYLPEYITPAPYVAGGVDLMLVRFTAHGELVPMFGVRGSPETDKITYLRYGCGVMADLLLATLHGEIVGTRNIDGAEAFEGSYAIIGATFGGALIHFGLAAQLSMEQPSDVGGAGADSVDMDTNFLATFGMGL